MATKTKVKTYRNGEPINLEYHECDGCEVLYINGHKTHEAGCPFEWKDYKVECKNCDKLFYPEFDRQELCSNHCYADYWDLPCDCEFCIELELELQNEDC